MALFEDLGYLQQYYSIVSGKCVSKIDSIVAQLRVPDLPYPVGRKTDQEEIPWGPVLVECWSNQADSTVIQRLREREDRWSTRQVNSAYLADRIMDVFLRTSGLHFSLVTRVARLRFYLAWQLHRQGEAAVVGQSPLRLWLDHLVSFRGWSDGTGRSSKRLLQRLDEMIPLVAQAFSEETSALEKYLTNWLADDNRQDERSSLLHNRLLETEQGAARQRAADLGSANRVAKALDGRSLPVPILELIEAQWQVLLRQIALVQGLDSELWKQATRAMDWLVWAVDPALSDSNRERLYQVCGELPDRVAEIWQGTFDAPLPATVADPLQEHLVARLRGAELEVVEVGKRKHDPYWLQPPQLPANVSAQIGHWCVSGEGAAEQRRWLFTYFESSGEVLWTNGQGVKQGLEPAQDVAKALDERALQPLPEPQPFETVLANTLAGLTRVLDAQQTQRQRAADRARAEAEALRQEQDAARQRAEEEARIQAQQAAQEEAAKQKAANEAEMTRRQEQETQRTVERERLRQELQEQVDQMHLGAWVEITQPTGKLKLKLAVRINASGKLVFVDRLGLNKREINRQELADMLLENQARILNKGAEFEDTLSRVVGRIRVGR